MERWDGAERAAGDTAQDGGGFRGPAGPVKKVIDSNGSIAAGKGSDLYSNLSTFMSKRGDYVLFEARMDMMVALSACNGHRCAPIGIEIRGV